LMPPGFEIWPVGYLSEASRSITTSKQDNGRHSLVLWRRTSSLLRIISEGKETRVKPRHHPFKTDKEEKVKNHW
jgi:hypothetical protein